ncbi:MAG: Lysine--tRNA ligase [Candidatus Methanolliviera sp. GoM_asphalt]|nr:MAG: Lysine--tRNA ligase [Candidatus Methanolliviera sp. GoM_asphalt]
MNEIHWADKIAEEISWRDKNVIATGITPSGDIHIGNMREVLTGDMIYRALVDRGKDAELIYIADTFDPLRRVYPFLPGSYEEHVGKPLSSVPDPYGCHENYAEHFLDPFLDSMEKLGISAKIYRSNELYEKGLYEDAIRAAIKNRRKIADILKEGSGRELKNNWSPYNPLCENCGRINSSEVLGFDDFKVRYRCKCGFEGKSDIRKGEGKLGWRIDWPARWKILNVTVEPFGKDHATVGGSYDTGKVISKEIYGYEPPYPVIYEWISLKGRDMSSSKGVVIPIGEMLESVPPEVLRYLIARSRPNKHLNFDPGLPLLNLIGDLESINGEDESGGRELEFSLSVEKRSNVPFRHLINTIQIAKGDLKELRIVLKRSGYDMGENEERWAGYARNWLERYAPESMKFELKEELPKNALSLKEKDKMGLKILGERLKSDLSGEDIHNMIYKVAEEAGLKTKNLFEAIYISLLDKKSGPRAGLFIESVGIGFVKKRFGEVSRDEG